MSATQNPGIAIIGLAAELPSGNSAATNLNVDAFFEFLLNKGESYEDMPADRFNVEKIKGRGLGQLLTTRGSFLKDIRMFDPIEFGITTKDAAAMPVSTRKLIETTFLALLDSGIHYRGQNIGCFMSGVGHDILAISGQEEMDARGSFAGGIATVANRVSYHLDLRGPSIPTDTACSSSLVATHMAVQALKNGECEAAVVGGAQLNHRFSEWLMYSQGGIVSPDGKCKPWDASADGFGRAEGVVSMVVKTLDAAIRDGDKVYATILGTGINSCGSLAPVNAPVAISQMDAMKRAFAMAGRKPQEVDFLELHATGTASGDPTEANWVGKEFKRDDELIIGSIKGNVGHLEISSFMASLVKVVGMFKTGIIAPNVNFVTPNPAIHWEEYKFRVPLEPEPLPARAPTGRSLVAMTSSGITGTNGHCVVESAPKIPQATNKFWVEGANVPSLVVAAGLSPRSATAVSESIQDFVANYHNNDLARIFGKRARSLTWRSFAIANEGKLTRFAEPALIPKATPPLVFVFSGQGPQHFEMGRGLFATNAVFRSTVLELDAVHKQAAGYSLIERYGLFSGEGKDPFGDVWPIAVTLPSLAILHIALFDTLIATGIKPDIVIGHSAGETSVLYASGSGSKKLAVELAVARGKAMSLLEDKNGTMAAVSCSPEEAESIIADVRKEIGPGSLEIGCYNTPGSITLSGSATHIDLAVAKATEAGIFARRLRTRVPVHSAMMELCGPTYKELSAEVFKNHTTVKPAVKTFTTLNGEYSEEAFTSEYFWDSTRGPVKFTQAMQALTAKYHGATFLEIGPHPVLVSYLSTLAGKESTVTCPLKRSKTRDPAAEALGLLESLGKLVVAGHNTVDFDILYNGLGENKEPPLSFPLARKDVSYHGESLLITKQNQHRNGPMNYPMLQMNAKTHPGLADHLIKDEPIMPAAGYVEMALEFGARKLWNVRFISILGLSSEKATPVNVKLEGAKWSIESASPGDQYKVYPLKYDRLHAQGYLSMDAAGIDDNAAIDIADIRGHLEPVGMKDFYKGLSLFAQYGKLYQRITNCYKGTNSKGQEEFLVEVRGNDKDLQPELHEYRIHPAILDAAVHTAVHPMITGYKVGTRYYLPSHFHQLEAHAALDQRPFPKTVYSHLTLVESTPTSLTYDCIIADDKGQCLLTMRGLEVALHGNFVNKVDRRFEVQPADTEIVVHRTGAAKFVPENGALAPTVLEYKRGTEMELQAVLAPMDTLAPHQLWFHASDGLSGDASQGFARAIRKEFAAWTVRLATFAPSWTVEDRLNALNELMAVPDCEVEMYVDEDGTVRVPRVTEIPAPAPKVAFDANLPWTQERSRLVRVAAADVPPQHVTVDVTGATEATNKVWSFVGTVHGTFKRVAGITTGALTNSVVAHEGSIVEVPGQTAPDALAHAIVGLALSPINAARTKSLSVAVEETETGLGAAIVDLVSRLGAKVTSFPKDLTLSALQQLNIARPNVVIAGSSKGPSAQLIKDFSAPGGKAFYWQDAESGIQSTLSADPWAIGQALSASTNAAVVPGSYVAPLELSGVQPQADIEYRAPLFDSKKSYILVGGIGSLGVDIAYWMYKNGARYIVLTSRSGRASLARTGSHLSRRLLAYMDTLPDLTLRLVACDALSVKDTSALINSLEYPLGGTMLLSVVLVDRSFVSQTEETFEAAWKPKTGAFDVLESLVDLNSLDFTIIFSSVSAMFGNAGQTNYASANTALSGLARKYRRAFSLIVPGIVDSYVALHNDTYAERLNHLSAWGFSSIELCQYIGDGIRKLQDGPLGQFVPDFNWNSVHAHMGASTLYDHLVTDHGDEEGGSSSNQPASLKEIICKTLSIAPEDLSANVPFTSYGLDSLSAASLSYALAPVLRISQIQLLADVTLAHLEERLAAEGDAPAAKSADSIEAPIDRNVAERDQKVNEMVAAVGRYDSNWPVTKTATTPKPTQKTVFITGTTGSLGAHTLARLARSSDVAKVYAFVRKSASASGVERQAAALTSRGIDASILKSSKVVVLEGDLSAESLGLEAAVYEQLLNTVTDVAHLGWTIDFALPLSGYEKDLRGLRAIIELAIGSGTRPAAKFLFSSSAGLFRNLYGLDMPESVPEEFISNAALAIGGGYTESKWIAEGIIAAAAEKTSLKPSVIRVTQLTGGLNGAWKEAEWFPALVATSTALGCLPNNHESCAWMDVDTAASTVIDMFDSEKPVLHLQHSKPRALNELMEPLAASLNLPLVSYSEWLEKLVEQSNKVSRGEIREVSRQLSAGIRLLDVFRSLLRKTEVDPQGTFEVHPKIDMKVTIGESKTLQDSKIRQLDATDVARWVSFWRSTGYVPAQ